jgi:ubiquinone biosynthesis protein Coq4
MMLDSKALPGLNIPAFLKLIESPYDTQAAFDLIRTLVGSSEFARISQCFLQNTEADKELQEMHRARYCPRFPTNEELLDNPPNSLGRRLADHLITNKISLDFQGIDLHNLYNKMESFLDYTRLRSLRVHDILHVMLGADISPIGEGQVGAFQGAQYGGIFHAVTISFVTMHVAFIESERMHRWMELLNEALEAGRKAPSFYSIAWEKYFAEDIDVLRRRFNIPKLGVWEAKTSSGAALSADL